MGGFSALEGRYNDTVYLDLAEVLDLEDNVWTVAVIDMMRVGEVADGLFMTAVFAPGRLIHRAAPFWTLDEARAYAADLFAQIVGGTFVPINYEIKPLVPHVAPEDEDAEGDASGDDAP